MNKIINLTKNIHKEKRIYTKRNKTDRWNNLYNTKGIDINFIKHRIDMSVPIINLLMKQTLQIKLMLETVKNYGKTI